MSVWLNRWWGEGNSPGPWHNGTPMTLTPSYGEVPKYSLGMDSQSGTPTMDIERKVGSAISGETGLPIVFYDAAVSSKGQPEGFGCVGALVQNGNYCWDMTQARWANGSTQGYNRRGRTALAWSSNGDTLLITCEGGSGGGATWLDAVHLLDDAYPGSNNIAPGGDPSFVNLNYYVNTTLKKKWGSAPHIVGAVMLDGSDNTQFMYKSLNKKGIGIDDSAIRGVQKGYYIPSFAYLKSYYKR